MITLQLCLPPEATKATFEETATLQDLQQKVCSHFGIKSCSLQFGYPPKTLTIQESNKATTLVAAGIQNKDKIKVLPSAKMENPYKKKKPCIPGLTKQHYVQNSNQSALTPKLVSRQCSPASFLFRWTAGGSRGESYDLYAQGNDVRSLSVHCQCISFSKRGEAKTSGKVRVCKHLAAALDSVVDPKGVYTEAVDLLSDSSDDEEIRNKKRPATNQPSPIKTKKRRLPSRQFIQVRKS